MAKSVIVYDKPNDLLDGMAVRPTHKITLPEGTATIKELLEDFRILVQFDDVKVRPNFRELKPEEIGAKVITQEAPKPPVGLIPRYIWIAHRVEEIQKAIQRYEHAGHAVPRAWRSELMALQGSVFNSIKVEGKNLKDFATTVQFHPAYSVEELNQMVDDVVPFLAGIGLIDIDVIDGQLVNVYANKNEVLTPPFDEKHKNLAYLCAFLLNNSQNILLRG
jgi:hypothetical protein